MHKSLHVREAGNASLMNIILPTTNSGGSVLRGTLGWLSTQMLLQETGVPNVQLVSGSVSVGHTSSRCLVMISRRRDQTGS